MLPPPPCRARRRNGHTTKRRLVISTARSPTATCNMHRAVTICSRSKQGGHSRIAQSTVCGGTDLHPRGPSAALCEESGGRDGDTSSARRPMKTLPALVIAQFAAKPLLPLPQFGKGVFAYARPLRHTMEKETSGASFMSGKRTAVLLTLFRGLLLSIVITLIGMLTIAALAVFARISDSLLCFFNQAIKLIAHPSGCSRCHSVAAETRGFLRTGAALAMAYMILGYALYLLLGGGAFSAIGMLGEILIGAAASADSPAQSAQINRPNPESSVRKRYEKEPPANLPVVLRLSKNPREELERDEALSNFQSSPAACTVGSGRALFRGGKSHFPEQKSFPCRFCARGFRRNPSKIWRGW